MRILIITGLLLVVCLGAFSQNSITGKLTTEEGEPIPFANVLVLTSLDTTLVKGALSSESGEFELDKINNGTYIVRYSVVGFKTYHSPVFELSSSQASKNFGTVVMDEDAQQLAEVTIQAEKQLYQQEIDRTVVNVQSSILTKGSSALQVLERAPGIYVNRQNNSIVLNGKSSVMVMQNGKPIRMSSDQVVAMLNGMSADNIDKIELITTPPAKYDAEGTAGLVNIVFKKGEEMGTKGSVSLTAGYGVAEKAMTSINLTHKTSKVDIYGSYSFSHDKGSTKGLDKGYFNGAAMGATDFNFRRSTDFVSTSHNAVLGFDAKLTPTTTIGSSINYNNNSVTYDVWNRSEFTLLPDSLLLMNANLNGPNSWNNWLANFYIEKELGNGGKINFDLDYLNYTNENNYAITTMFLDREGNDVPTGGGLFSPRQRSVARTPIKVGVSKIDYTKQLNPKMKLELGIKGTYTKSSNGSKIESQEGSEWIGDLRTTNDIDMSETISAAYTSLNSQLDASTNLNVGIRYEYSHTLLESEDEEYKVDRKVSKFFPSVFFSKKLGDKSEFQLSYTKRISRPSYNDLASFLVYNDPNTVIIGNPSLKPVFTDNIKAGYNFSGYSVSLLFSNDKNPVAAYQAIQSPDGDLFYVTTVNLKYQRSFDLQANIPVQVNPWWSMNANVTGSFRQYKLEHTEEKLEKQYFNFNISGSQTFKLPENFSLEVSGWYVSRQFVGSKILEGFGMLNAGLKKDFKNNGGSLQLSVTDILKTLKFHGYFGHLTEEAFALDSETMFKVESSIRPIVKLSYTRTFGNNSVKDSRRRGTGSQEERGRVKQD